MSIYQILVAIQIIVKLVSKQQVIKTLAKILEVAKWAGLSKPLLPDEELNSGGRDGCGSTEANTQTLSCATVVDPQPGAPATNTVANHAERPEKFNGQNFKRWQQKMFFYLTTLGLARFLKETVPQVEPPAEGQSLRQQDFVLQGPDCHKKLGVLETLIQNRGLRGLIPSGNKRKDKNARMTRRAKGSLSRLKWTEAVLWGSATADIKGEGDVILKMTSRRAQVANVLYVPEFEQESCVSVGS
ncbi:hypothetical protein Tco_1080020 [Tanacetum coccineum]|uniref:Uncharacterized protein n=1 Tax=Tanacetum coccineum TaxID=301880 RepID=A0ABQ5HU34_9ASTR